MPKIHPTAVVDASVKLASGAVIGPWCVVGPGVTIGDDTELVSHVVIDRDTTIGRENVLHPFTVVGGPPQDKKYHGERTTLEVGDRNHIREYASIHRGTANGGGVTVVGSDNLIMGCVHVAHDCRIGSGVILANNAMVAGHVTVCDGANVGGGAGLHHFVRVGTRSFVGAMARVSKDVPPFMIVEGNPAEVRGHNAIAMRRMGLVDAEVEAMKDAYKRLFRDRGGSILAKLDALRADYSSCVSVMALCDAVLETTGGVHGRAQESGRSDDKRGTRVGTPGAPQA
ncbi:MAG: acyl-ACP--UDP-N-acetylglucosamine O-acyltransferase [Planctomycetes bacterium]|nr:acyl-ACP--UDP-N-acetylglucosamine O-acyltransferase [Planctomycetota bacterium]